MSKKISNQFLLNYILMFIISTVIAVFTFMLMDFANHVISSTLTKNNYTAKKMMQDDYYRIDPSGVINNGGGIQVIDKNYEVVYTKGLDTINKSSLSVAEFTEFLMNSRSKGVEYSYSIKYNPKEQFWLVVTFPTSIRIDFEIAYNKKHASKDMQNVAGVILAIVLFYLILLAISTVIYSKLTSISIVSPLKKICESARRFRDGDYSVRVDLNLKNEFAELQDTFNSMARRIENEIFLREKSEDSRKKLVLDISHDLKNPLASIMGYAELCMSKAELSKDELYSYTKTIYDSSVRANSLITDLFELSKMESSEFVLNRSKVDVCEYIREEMGKNIPIFDDAGFKYEFDIPEKEIYAIIDTVRMDRVFQNLVVNTVKYNSAGTQVVVSVFDKDDELFIIFKDNGIGIPEDIAKDIFKPFVRVDDARNSNTGGTGLGLAIAEKIITAHGGSIRLITDVGRGCEFVISIPKAV